LYIVLYTLSIVSFLFVRFAPKFLINIANCLSVHNKRIKKHTNEHWRSHGPPLLGKGEPDYPLSPHFRDEITKDRAFARETGNAPTKNRQHILLRKFAIILTHSMQTLNGRERGVGGEGGVRVEGLRVREKMGDREKGQGVGEWKGG
jgi:hypothetical protein